MAKVLCKEGVLLKGVTGALAYILLVLEQYARKSADLPDLVITSIYDGTHLPNSKHYRGEAIDLRTRNLEVGRKELLRSELEASLNTHPIACLSGLDHRFRVIFESGADQGEHIHIQVRMGTDFPGV